jgi:hypothetical protein
MSDDEQRDPNEPVPKADDLSDKRLRKEEAEGLLDPKGVFMLGVRGVRIRWFQELMAARDQETKDYLTSKLQVLDEVTNALQGFVNDYKVALKNKR